MVEGNTAALPQVESSTQKQIIETFNRIRFKLPSPLHIDSLIHRTQL
jgi:hypothetical protein